MFFVVNVESLGGFESLDYGKPVGSTELDGGFDCFVVSEEDGGFDCFVTELDGGFDFMYYFLFRIALTLFWWT